MTIYTIDKPELTHVQSSSTLYCGQACLCIMGASDPVLLKVQGLGQIGLSAPDMIRLACGRGFFLDPIPPLSVDTFPNTEGVYLVHSGHPDFVRKHWFLIEINASDYVIYDPLYKAPSTHLFNDGLTPARYLTEVLAVFRVYNCKVTSLQPLTEGFSL